MSMVEVTRDLPRSSDGLPMEWIDAPFGPFFPGLPGGLLLTLTLDGDTVAGADARSLTGNGRLIHTSPLDTPSFVERLTNMDPLAPVAYGLLACQALEDAASVNVPADMACARAAALERERISSHLGWLALFGQQTGFGWLMQRAASLQLASLHADLGQVMALKPAIHALIKRLQRTPLLKSRTAGIGRLSPDMALHGPVARAAGIGDDARNRDGIFTMLGFTMATRKEGDVLARLQVRLDEMTHSLSLIEAAGAMAVPIPSPVGDVSANGMAVVETPRGPARLQLTLDKGQVTAAQLETPSTSHLGLVEALTAQQALGDALTAVVSLDLSPWEVRQ
ncbi:MAG TPA: NADH-quinone oxidoreductase subunit D [Gammaproteobacteria bacterium]|nr:NADH-quinone oxidoreductase subunit D [Gammaproteobacteria bacterium]